MQPKLAREDLQRSLSSNEKRFHALQVFELAIPVDTARNVTVAMLRRLE